MKILIADDMEGITGVVSWDHVDPDHGEYARFRKLMTADVNAAVRGAFNAGATEVVVTDGHHNGMNVLIEDLDPRARLNTGSPSDLSMVEGVQSGVDAVLLVGYHAMAGAEKAILCHTWSGAINNLWINDRLCGEIGLNALVNGEFNAPVLMISGDAAACREGSDWVEGICQAVVKIASGRYAAECLPPEQTSRLIEQTAEEAVRRFAAGKGPRPLKGQTPIRVKMEFRIPNQADNAEQMPGARRLDGRTIEFSAGTMLEAYRGFRAAASLGSGN